MNLGSQHLFARRRHEPFPSRSAWKRALDYLMYGVGLVQWVALLPQILSIYVHDQVAGISILTWSLLTFFNFLWMVYGLVHHDRAVFVANVLLMCGDLAIVLGVLAQ